MENDLKDFMEKVKDEFKKARSTFDELKKMLVSIEGRLAKLEDKGKESDKDEGWL